MDIYSFIRKTAGDGKKLFAVLIDPDKHTPASLKKIKTLSVKAGVDLFFFGGSLLTNDRVDEYLTRLKEDCSIPVVLFPGNNFQVNRKADGILFLSLISGRNPELLIGKHVVAAPYLKASRLEVIPTGYILIDGGCTTTVSYISSTIPIPSGKPGIASCTALAGEFLGLKLIYLDAGSGAHQPVSQEMISQVKQAISVPLIVGGGIRTAAKARRSARAGADIVVVGNALENNPELVMQFSESIHKQ